MKKSILILLVLITSWASAQGYVRYRTELNFPDILGYKIVPTDLHIHTAFSDGSVWPHIRVEEAWHEGLDAIAISDHIEYKPHKNDLTENLDRVFEIAQPSADMLNVTLIKSAEMTRKEPPGHFNALFVDSINALDNPDYMKALQNAHEQDAFVFWNHPGWKQPGLVSVWYDEIEAAHKKGLFQGIEIVNGWDYYPEAHQWCIEKGLTLLGTSDIHTLIHFDYDDHRPMTLVLAKDNSAEALKDALQNQRTLVYFEDKIIGDAKYQAPLAAQMLTIPDNNVTLYGKGRKAVFIQNKYDFDIELELLEKPDNLWMQKKMTLKAGKTSYMAISSDGEIKGEQNVMLKFKINNLIISPDKYLEHQFNLKIEYK